MANSDELIELLFFDTFSHEIHEDLNLDLVQFPQPVYITELRIIPLGARVQADFPGGVRLGATNPSKFHIELFVNDLAKPGASTFECLGDFEYNQNDCINLQCAERATNVRQIPTDGLVLRGWYTTITLAVYGSVAKNGIGEQQISSPPPPVIAIEPVLNVQVSCNSVLLPSSIDAKSDHHLIEIDWHHAGTVKDIANVHYPKVIGTNYYNDDVNGAQGQHQTQSNVSASDSARQYTENWVASTGSNVTNVIGATLIRAKSPDIDNWDVDDDLNNTSTLILSPRSVRRSRSPPDTRRTAKRDWSKSPEYRRRRSYERGVLDKKLSKTREYESAALRRSPPPLPLNRMPRTPPPEDVQPPNTARRPRTPESRLSDDFNRHKFYAKSVQSPQSATDEVDVANLSTALSSLAPTEPEEDAMSQGEPFEPILSDEEIGDDALEQYEIDYDEVDITSIYSALKHFNPFTEELKHYIPIDDKMSANARELIELATKCLHRSKLKESACIEKTFSESQSNEMRENWVHAAEQLIQIINLIYNLAGATQTRSQQALNALIALNRHQLVDWMRIGLSFDCANSQQQPGYKIRHIKCGVRLIELLAADEMFVEYLIVKEKFNVFEYLYRLYEQKFMALSIKLMICKAIYACLDTRTGIEYFTEPPELEDVKPPITENGYQKLIKLLQENPLTRIKFALKSILKKVNLYESLQMIRDIVNRAFVNGDVKSEMTDIDENVVADQKLLNSCLTEVWSAFTWDAQGYSQPKRFLPISTKFEKVVDANASKATFNGFLQYFRAHIFLESLLLIVSNHNSNSIVSDEVFDRTLLMLEALCRTENGLNYLSEKAKVTNVLVKCLLQAPQDPQQVEQNRHEIEEIAETDSMAAVAIEDGVDIDEDSRMHNLGIEIAYKVKSKYCLDAITDVPTISENREEQLVEHFYTLYSLAVADNQLGRNYVIETITMNSNIIIILKQIENEKKILNAAVQKQNVAVDLTNADADAMAHKRGPILNYAIDLIELTVRFGTTNLEYLRQHGQILLNLVKSHDQFDDVAISQILQDTAAYLKPLQIQNIFSYDNIAPLCEIVKRNLDFITTFPGDLIMALRIIRYLAIPDTRTFDRGSDFADTFGDAGAMNKTKLAQEQHQIELKHKFVILQFYSADGIATCIQIMDKLTTYFAQPAVHAATLGGLQGQLLTQILLPTVEILRKMLTYVIDCRNTEFKDLTAIEAILKTYTLVTYVPLQSIAANEVQQIQDEIIKILMAYTQPTPANGVDTESVHKSLWTQMIGELCKYTMNGPYTIMSGLTILSQLLPIPLPVPTKHALTASEQSRLITERQLWSAHLHPKSIQISEMIQSLCISSYPPLLDLLARVIGQLADLAPNMTLVVTKAVTDLLVTDGSLSIQASDLQNAATNASAATNIAGNATSIAPNQPHASTIMAYVNPQTKRILTFLCNILCYPPIKVAFLSLIQSKVYELLAKVLAVKSTSVPSTLLPILNQEQESVLTLFHTILNADISLINQFAPENGEKSLATAELVLGCTFPPKDCLIGIIGAILDWFFGSDESFNTIGCQFSALKVMTLLAEYDYTTYHLRTLLDKRKEQLLKKIRALSRPSEDDQNAHENLLTFLLFLQSLARTDLAKSERTYACTELDLVKILQFKRPAIDVDPTTDISAHPLLALDQHLKRLLSQPELSEDTKLQLLEISFNVKNLLKVSDVGLASLDQINAIKDVLQDSPTAEPLFPQGEGIVAQFSMRPVFNVVSNDLKSAFVVDQLNTNYWYSHSLPHRFDELVDGQLAISDAVPCDLIETIKTCLPPDTNLTTDCKRLLHLSASPQSNRERTTSAPCFRTRRVEVEPTTGRPEKKIYMTRGRGFQRTAPTRGDLFRSRPPNTSRPPSLHVDDFLALETCGAQPTGPTGYNKLSREIISIRGTRGGRGRGRIGMTSNNGGTPYRHNTSIRRTNLPSTWANHLIGSGGNSSGQHDTNSTPSSSQHFRTATSEPVHSSHFQSEYSSQHFNSPGGRGSRRGGLRPPRTFNKFN